MSKLDHRDSTKKDYKLNDKQYDEHCRLMDMRMIAWPRGVYDYVLEDSKKMGFCGEVVVCAVARWCRENV